MRSKQQINIPVFSNEQPCATLPSNNPGSLFHFIQTFRVNNALEIIKSDETKSTLSSLGIMICMSCFSLNDNVLHGVWEFETQKIIYNKIQPSTICA